MSFKYCWTFKDYPKTKKYSVFSTFACGGGSTMGYKLAGYNVIGANDVDPKMAKIYQHNHHPTHYFLEDIRTFTDRDDLPQELFELDILDGSPPCTTFSSAGKREESWGKTRKYTEGDFSQTLDDLYFAYIRLVKKLKPKVFVSENVTGLVKGSAIIYLKNIIKGFDEGGYTTQVFQLNAATMGVPQKRERIFIIGHKKDFNLPKLKLEFNEKPVLFGEFRSEVGRDPTPHEKKLLAYSEKGDTNLGDIVLRLVGKISGFGQGIIGDMDVVPTIIATGDNFRQADRQKCSPMDYILAGTFPTDYDFLGLNEKYVIGMSVPPVMVAQIAQQIKRQWLDVVC